MHASVTGTDALGLLFLNIFAEQMGLPIPSYPALLVAGSLASLSHSGTLLLVLALALMACEIADSLWFLAGQRYGQWLMSGLCRVSLEPDTCIRKNRNLYLRFGPRVLLVAKFLPGLGALSTLMAGATHTPYRRFLAYDAAGSLLWIVSGIGLGMVFHKAVLGILDWVESYIAQGLTIVLLLFAVFVAWKWWRRQQILRITHRVRRISVDELKTLQDEGAAPVIIDVRAEAFATNPIPGAIHLPMNMATRKLPTFDADRPVIVYCTCPNEISATLVADRLRARGALNTFALLGGSECWHARMNSLDTSGAACNVH